MVYCYVYLLSTAVCTAKSQVPLATATHQPTLGLFSVNEMDVVTRTEIKILPLNSICTNLIFFLTHL